jgi:hypothetical protein
VTKDFDELIDAGGLEPDELLRLRSVHEMLVAAGPPPALTSGLSQPPPPPAEAEVVSIADRRGRRVAAGLIAAVVAATALVAGGFALGDRFGSGNGDVVRVVQLEGVGLANASATVSLRSAESGGNWPMELTVSGLPQHASERGYYELFVWRRGKPGYPCVGFKMAGGATTVRFNVPYELRDETELVITTVVPGKIGWPGKVVMRTV